MSLSKYDKLREEVALLKIRLKTARDKEILLLTKLIATEGELKELLEARRSSSQADNVLS